MTQNRARFHSQLEDDLLRDVERLQLSAPAEHALEHIPEHHELSDHFDGRGLQLGIPYSRVHPFHQTYNTWYARVGHKKTRHPLHKQYEDWVVKNALSTTRSEERVVATKGRRRVSQPSEP